MIWLWLVYGSAAALTILLVWLCVDIIRELRRSAPEAPPDPGDMIVWDPDWRWPRRDS